MGMKLGKACGSFFLPVFCTGCMGDNQSPVSEVVLVSTDEFGFADRLCKGQTMEIKV